MSGNSFSARNGRGKGYSKADLIDIVWENLQGVIEAQGLLDQRYGYIPSSWGGENLGPAADNLEEGEFSADQSKVWLNRTLKLKVNFRYDPEKGKFLVYYYHDGRLPPELAGDLDRLFDLLEALHSVVSRPVRKSRSIRHVGYDKALGKELLRDAINEDMALYSTPYRMLENGQIVEINDAALADLADEALKIKAKKSVEEPVIDTLQQGITLFLKREATNTEKKAAIKELAAALESLRPKVKQHLLSEDERDLFSLANNFAIRHQNSKQKSSYDKGIWYDWMFYANLAALVTVIKVLQGQRT
jgi:hypothetical protein